MVARLVRNMCTIGLPLLFLLLLVMTGWAQDEPPEPPGAVGRGFRMERVSGNTGGIVPSAEDPGVGLAVLADYLVTVIPPPTEYERSRGLGINSDGDVVGRFYDFNESTEEQENRQAFVWDSVSGASLLPKLVSPGGESSAWGINDDGYASGYATDSSGFNHAVRWDTTTLSVPLDLGTLENPVSVFGESSTGYDLNNLEEVVGMSDLWNDDENFTTFHAFVYEDTDGMQDLGTLVTIYPSWLNGWSIAYERTVGGNTVGTANFLYGPDWVFRPFIHNDTDGMLQLNIDPVYPMGEWYAVAINEAGQIGGHVIAAENQSLPYYWATPLSTPVEIDMPVGFPYGEIYGVNASGKMVGIMWDTDAISGAVEHAFIFDTMNGVQDLNDLIDPTSGWVLFFARDINDSGQIVGYGTYMGEHRAFVLKPNPMPNHIFLPLIAR